MGLFSDGYNSDDRGIFESEHDARRRQLEVKWGEERERNEAFDEIVEEYRMKHPRKRNVFDAPFIEVTFATFSYLVLDLLSKAQIGGYKYLILALFCGLGVFKPMGRLPQNKFLQVLCIGSSLISRAVLAIVFFIGVITLTFGN